MVDQPERRRATRPPPCGLELLVRRGFWHVLVTLVVLGAA